MTSANVDAPHGHSPLTMPATTQTLRLDTESGVTFWTTLYTHARQEVYMRHDFLQKIFGVAVVGVFALLKFAVDDPRLLFMVPAFTGMCFIFYLYNLGAKSRHATYSRVLEIQLQRANPALQIPLPE